MLLKIILNFFKKHLEVISSLLLSIAPFIWIHSGEIIFGPDTLWSLNTPSDLAKGLHAWKSASGFGYGWADIGATIHNIFITGVLKLGVSLNVAQKILICLLIFLSSYIMTKLIQEV